MDAIALDYFAREDQQLFNYEFRRRSKMKQRARACGGRFAPGLQNFAEHRRLFPSSRRRASKEVKIALLLPCCSSLGNRGVCNDGVVSGDG